MNLIGSHHLNIKLFSAPLPPSPPAFVTLMKSIMLFKVALLEVEPILDRQYLIYLFIGE